MIDVIDILDQINGIREFAGAVSAIGENNTHADVSGSQVSFILDCIDDKLDKLKWSIENNLTEKPA